MTNTITGGTVDVMQRVKTGDYEHKEARVTLSFSVAEGHDHRDLLDQVSTEANDRVRSILGLGGNLPARKPGGRPAKPAAPVTEPAAEPMQNKVESKPAVEAKPAASAASVVEDELDTPPVKQTEQAPASTASAASVVDEEEEDWMKAASEVTDKALTDAMQAANADLVKAGKIKDGELHPIRKLVGKFVPNGQRVTAIPQEQRHVFLKELDALAKGA